MNPALLARFGPSALIYLIMLWLSPAAGFAVGILAAGLWAWTRHPAQSLFLAALSYPGGVWLIDHPGAVWLLAAAGLGGLMAWLQRADI